MNEKQLAEKMLKELEAIKSSDGSYDNGKLCELLGAIEGEAVSCGGVI